MLLTRETALAIIRQLDEVIANLQRKRADILAALETSNNPPGQKPEGMEKEHEPAARFIGSNG